MLLVPAEIPVTSPELFTDAMPVLVEIQGLEVAGVPEPVSWVVALMHKLKVPEMVGGFNVIVTEAVFVQLCESVPVTV